MRKNQVPDITFFPKKHKSNMKFKIKVFLGNYFAPNSGVFFFFDVLNNNFIMLSQAGRQYERSKKIKPLEKAQR